MKEKTNNFRLGPKVISPLKRKKAIGVSLSPDEINFIKGYGNGSLTEGVRAMVRVCQHLQLLAEAQREARMKEYPGAPSPVLSAECTPDESCEHGTVGECPACVRDST